MRAHARFFLDAVKTNLQIALEYRAALVSQVIGMLLNDIIWIIFWTLFFQRFPVIQGWRIDDVLTMWAITAAGFGVAVGFFGNAPQLARIIAQGELDYYLGLPKNVLLHVLISKMDLPALGDILFGLGIFLGFLHPTPERIVLFLVLALCGTAVFLGFLIAAGSLAFWIGNSDGLTQQLFNGLISLSTYPSPLFHGWVKVIMCSLVPAWFIAHLPTALLHQFDLPGLLLEIGVAAGGLALGIGIFYRGLRRYESGSLMVLRS
ncbi:MAG TPA: ABC-2 family transporter protein [Chloroflexia bacterium]|nr:ABC-2 family transporter protein [Chloroflexia bacterium]